MRPDELKAIRQMVNARNAELEMSVEFGFLESLESDLADRVEGLLDFIDALQESAKSEVLKG